ncbi:Mg2+ and Co2+ transporter CorA [Paenibacillus sp. DS2015]|uniref:magnesium transporter CorA family protein n=1 Tax=Paenibacillus sp. DS2015 TaxID=3373917 RepID=UPI003D226974
MEQGGKRGRHPTEISFANKWDWHDLVVEDGGTPSAEIDQLRLNIPGMEEWLDTVSKVKGSYISVRFPNGVDPVIFGTMMYSVNSTIGSDRSYQQYHYFVNQDTLITMNIDDDTWAIMNQANRMTMFQQCEDAKDGLFVLTRTILHYLHQGMDQFEINLRELERLMEKSNRRNLMDQILTARFELLYWNNLFISFQELGVAANEAFHDKLEVNRFYQQLYYRLERIDRLFKHYSDEIDTLISIDDAVSSYRGNEIMKTLTIITAVFMPATVLGAIWGMNFDWIPFMKMSWGFIGMCLFISLSTVGMYLWMIKKGWTGDLLHGKSNKDNHL